MIGISEEQDLLRIHVLNEFTIDDFREFENAVTGELKSNPKIRWLEMTPKVTTIIFGKPSPWEPGLMIWRSSIRGPRKSFPWPAGSRSKRVRKP